MAQEVRGTDYSLLQMAWGGLEDGASITRHSKSRFVCAVKTLFLKFCTRKSEIISLKITYYVWKIKKKTVKRVKMHKFVVCACKYQDFAPSQKIVRGRTTVRQWLLETLSKTARRGWAIGAILNNWALASVAMRPYSLWPYIQPHVLKIICYNMGIF